MPASQMLNVMVMVASEIAVKHNGLGGTLTSWFERLQIVDRDLLRGTARPGPVPPAGAAGPATVSLDASFATVFGSTIGTALGAQRDG